MGAAGLCINRGGEGHPHKHSTLSYESLAGVQQNFTPFDNHPLYCQIFSNIFGLTHFIMHYPEGERRENWSLDEICTFTSRSLWTHGRGCTT